MGFVLVDLVLTIFVYLLFPVIYRLSNGKVPKKQGGSIALFNSIICALFFIVLRAIISGGEVAVGSFGPAFLYYFIAKSILVDKNLSEEDYERVLSGERPDLSNIKRCPKCNYQIFDGDKTCQLCGNPIGKPTKRVIKEGSKNLTTDNKEKTNTQDDDVFYCENCGYELFKHDKKCNFCGKVIDKTTKKELDD